MTDDTAVRPVGLVLVRPSQLLGSEPFYQELIAGVESVFGPSDVTLLLQIVTSRAEELATYRRWYEEGTVCGVLLVDLTRADARVDLLRDLGTCVVVVGDPETAGGFPAVWTDDASAMEQAVSKLAALGHRTIGRVSGPSVLAHSQIRTEAFLSSSRALNVAALEVEAQYSEEAGSRATTELLDGDPAPTAIIFDDDLMALGALSAAAGRGLRVPDDLSILAWDDSALCQLSSPKLSVMGHDVQAAGELAAQAMLRLINGASVDDQEAPVAGFVQRESVSAARAPQ